MLYLAIIGIACAVSAPSEGTAFIGRNNNESSFVCHFDEGEQNVAKVFMPSVYNVDAHNSFDCAKQKITNRTSSFFFDYIIKQYRSSRSGFCSVAQNVSMGKKKKFHSNVGVAFKKRNLLWSLRRKKKKKKISPKTLRPPVEKTNCTTEESKPKKSKPTRLKKKKCKTKKPKPKKKEDKCDLNCEEKKMFLRLKNIKRKRGKKKVSARHLDSVKVNEEVHSEGKNEKSIRQAALGNQQKEGNFVKGSAAAAVTGSLEQRNEKVSYSSNKKVLSDKVDESFSLLNRTRKNIRFSKYYFNNKKHNVDRIINLVSVKSVRGKEPVADNAARISDYDVRKANRITSRFRRNPDNSNSYADNLVPKYEDNLIAQPYPYSVNFKAKRDFLHAPSRRILYSERKKRKRKDRRVKSASNEFQIKLENWPFFKKINFKKAGFYDSRTKRYDESTPAHESNEQLTKTEEHMITESSSLSSEVSQHNGSEKEENPQEHSRSSEPADPEKVSLRESDFGNANIKTSPPFSKSTDEIKQITTENSNELNVSQEDKAHVFVDHTLEKPFLERQFSGKEFGGSPAQDSDLKTYETRYNLMTDFPLFSLTDPQSYQKYEMLNDKYLNPYRYLKIRHALRNYLIHNEVWHSPSKRHLSSERKKRCGGRSCSIPRKCWRSAPLLCVPYIKKGQEDVLKYLIKVMQKMMGRPFPPKSDIFEKTKYKPCAKKEPEPTCDDAEEEECECKTPPAPTCPPPPPPSPKPRPCPTIPLPATPKPCPTISCPTTPKPCPPPKPNCCPAVTPPRQCSRSNAWPPGFPFFIPRMEQILDQNSNQCACDEKATTSPPCCPYSIPIADTPFLHTPLIPTSSLTGVSSGPNPSLAPPVKISDPVHPTPSNANLAPASYSPNPSVVESNSLPPQVAEQTTFPSTCALCETSSPAAQEKYFPIPALPYNEQSKCAIMPPQYSEFLPPRPLNEQPVYSTPNYNPVHSQNINCDACFANAENTSPNVPQTLAWPSTTNPTPTAETAKYQSQIKEVSKAVKETEESSPGCPLQTNQFKKEEKTRKFELSKNAYKNNAGKALQYDEYPANEHQLPTPQINYDSSQQKMLRTMHHRGVPNQNFKFPPREIFPLYDYYIYDKYPLTNQNEVNGLKYGRYPVPQAFWKDYGRKIKKTETQGSSIRRKRGDNYFWPEKFDSYNDYLDDFSYNDENSDKHAGARSKNPDEAPPDPNWTPPSYDMFSELAKAVSEFNTTSPASVNASNSETTTSTIFYTSVSKSSANTTNQSITASAPKDILTSSTNTSLANVQSTKIIDDNMNNDRLSSSSSAFSSTSTSSSVSSLKTETNCTTQTNSLAATTSSRITDIGRGQDRSIISKKSGKTGFFQTNSKTMQNALESNSGRFTTTKNSRKETVTEDPEQDRNQNSDLAEEGQIPTTLKTASIVKGPKKFLTKPSPKVYSKVYPDSLALEVETNQTVITNVLTTTKSTSENTTAILSTTPVPDIRLQLLAVCEGYLEVVKLIKTQNQTIGEDLNADLARYCENIISQSFNFQSDKPKKPETNESIQIKNLTKVTEAVTNRSVSSNTNAVSSKPGFYETAKEFFDAESRDKILAAILNNPIFKRELEERNKKLKNKKLKKKLDENTNSTKTERSDDLSGNLESGTKKTRRKNYCLSSRAKKQMRRLKEETEEDLLKKGMTQEQIELLHLLRKRKRALLTWLFNSKDQARQNDMQETEYFDDEDMMAPDSDLSQYSGTIKPKRGEKSSEELKKNLSFVNESIFPVYAKQYGYDKGGEIREVEVLWRKVNEKTHEEKIFKNVSVLALLMMSTSPPNTNREETRFVGNNGYENEEISENDSKSENKVRFAADLAETCNNTTPTAPTTPGTNCSSKDVSKTRLPANSTAVSRCNSTTKLNKKNATHTFISKPDPSSIVGMPPNVTKAHRNITRKPSHKFGVAKDLFQEYTIEFLNYAVYILPIMFTILFLFCCLCCAVHILKAKKSIKKRKKKKKKPVSTDESSDTSEESERESKKRKRDAKRKRNSKCNADSENLEKKRSKKFWSVLKLPSKQSREFNEESIQSEKKKNFLRFLKSKKEEGKMEGVSSVPLREFDEYPRDYAGSGGDKSDDNSSRRTKREDDKRRADDYSEAAERRELIALLEELKKIETEHTGEKKEVKSVHVQYMTQEDENSVFQRPDFSYPYEKNVFGMPKGYSFCSKQFPCQQKDQPAIRDYEFYEDVNELTELIPCKCSYYSKRNDYLRHCDFGINPGGRCDRFLKIFRDAGMNRNKPFREKDFRKNESENRSFIFNKYKSISTDTSEELMGVRQKNAGTEVRFTDNASPFALPCKKNAALVEDMENLKLQLNKKNYVRLKDNGVLCRL